MDAASDAVRDLVQQHLPLVRSLARRYSGSGEPLEDLVQVGSLGLVAAARRFDPSRGVPFAGFAAPTIDGELRRHLRDRVATIRVPRREQERSASLRRSLHTVEQRLGRGASFAETAADAGVVREEAQAALAGPAHVVSLSAAEGLASTAAEDEFAACEDRAFVHDLIAALGPRERQVVELRFAGDLSQTEIARRLNMSQSQASRALSSALAKLRRSIENRAA